jgi:peptidoglycan/xylan/chitin deacetylase (PgdA/CDA1 family)
MLIKRKLLNNINNNFSILLFHGVVKDKKYLIRNYNNKHILDIRFYKILKFLKKNGNAISIDEIVYYIKNNIKIPKNSFTISFDDGFENNFSVAAPILDDLKIPSTFYFSTDFVSNNSMSWIDKVEYCFEKDKKKNFLKLEALGNYDISTIGKKIKTLDSIRYLVKKNFNLNIDKFVTNVFKSFDRKEIKSSNSDIDKKISWKKINLLKTNKLFTLGGHSHIHMPLTYFSLMSAEKQIIKSLNLFKKNVNLRLKHYSYPEGQKKDYNKKIELFLKNKGIECCPTAIDGFNRINSNLFNLKRIQVS